MRKRANSAAALVPPLWVAPSLISHTRNLLDDNLTIDRRSRRGSAEESEGAFVAFVREHRRSGSATPTDRSRRPPSPKLASGKVLSPLPELTSGSGKSTMLAAMESSRLSPTKMMRSPRLATINLLEHAVESDEEAFETSSVVGGGSGDLRSALESHNQSSVSVSSAGSGERTGPPVRPLQGRRPILRKQTDISIISQPSTARESPQPATTVRVDFPSGSPEEDRQLPSLPPTTTFRPKSRRTLSLPFQPNLPAPKASGSMLPPPRPLPHLPSPFAVPASALKAPKVLTSVSTSPSIGSLSTFSSWDLPVAANAESIVGRHRVLSHLESYNLPQPSERSARPLPTPIRPRLTSSPSSYSPLSPPTAARLRMERSQTQPFVSSRLAQTGAGSPASSLGSQPSSLKRASTIAHHRPLSSTNVTKPSAQGPVYPTYHATGHSQASGGHRTQKVHKLRSPTSYSLQNCRELPLALPGPLSPSNSSDGLPLVRTRSRDRRNSISSLGSIRDGHRFPAQTLPADTAALASGMARSSSAVSLAGLINFGRQPSVKDPALVRAQQEELARKAAVAAALQAEEDDSDDDAPYLSYRTM